MYHFRIIYLISEFKAKLITSSEFQFDVNEGTEHYNSNPADFVVVEIMY
jgi:hypothetical protein